MRGRHILVAEDEYVVAQDLCQWLQRCGAHVVGPASHLERARTLVASEAIDAALLDIHLRKELIFPVAQDLADRGIPFLFLSGFSRSTIPQRFTHIELFEKPVIPERLETHLRKLLGG